MPRLTALVGMNNPHSRDYRMALAPDPVGSTGWRIWQMLHARTGATQADYMGTFHRYNLVTQGKWGIFEARARWEQIAEEMTSTFDTIVLLGAAVRRAIGVDLPELHVSRSLIAIPHPSGLNRWYNDPLNRQIVEVLLEELYVEAISD